MSRRVGGREATTGVIPGEVCLSVGKPSQPAPDGWKWVSLLDVARLESGHTPSRRKPEYWGGEVPWIGIKDATGNHGRTIYDTIQHTNDLGIQNSAARILPRNTVCLSRTASVGYVVVVGKPMATSQDFANWVCGPRLDFRFLKYAFLADNKSLNRFSHGSTHQTIYYPELKAFHVCMPEIAEQQCIADTLQALDDKIDLNRRMAATLEEMARALYRSWFVDFDPVKAKAEGLAPAYMDEATAALFPDRFGDDGLPEGWRIASIYEVSKVQYGAPFKSNLFNTENLGRPLVRIRDLKNQQAGVFTTEIHSKEYLIQPGDTVVGMDGDFTPYTWCAEPSLMNQRICCFIPLDSRDHAFVRLAIPALLKAEENAAVATTVIHLGKKDIDTFNTVLPPSTILDAFAKVANPILSRIVAAGLETKTLASLRETLLPKLMSGELRMGEAREMIEEAA